MSSKTWLDILAYVLEWLTGEWFEDLRRQREEAAKADAVELPKLAELQQTADAARAEAERHEAAAAVLDRPTLQDIDDPDPEELSKKLERLSDE